jgi:hypothetical protein
MVPPLHLIREIFSIPKVVFEQNQDDRQCLNVSMRHGLHLEITLLHELS